MTVAFTPTRPRLSVTLDNNALSASLEARLTSLVVRQALGTSAVLELSFADVPSSDLALVRCGITASVSLAPGGDMFSGRVTEIAQDYSADRGAIFKVTARDALHQLACRESLLALENVSASDLADRFAGDLGLTARCQEAAPKRQVVLQHQQSDLDFLNDVAADAGLYPVVRQSELHLLSLAGDGETGLELTLGANLLAFRGRVVADRNLPAGTVFSRDPVTLETRKTSLSLARQDQVEMRDPGDLGVGEHHLLNRMTGSPDEATALLQASLDRAAADVVVAEGLCEGNLALVPGRIIDVRRVADAFIASYIVTRVQHRLTATEGFVTEFSTERFE
ncbi:MAG: contractile injection system protein, VgrG/Pvc8 family, partial [Deltaproteobacteria bacterium]